MKTVTVITKFTVHRPSNAPFDMNNILALYHDKNHGGSITIINVMKRHPITSFLLPHTHNIILYQ